MQFFIADCFLLLNLFGFLCRDMYVPSFLESSCDFYFIKRIGDDDYDGSDHDRITIGRKTKQNMGKLEKHKDRISFMK